MRHLTNIHGDAELLKKMLTGDASESEKEQARQLLSKHPQLQQEVEALQQEGALEQTFEAHSHYDSRAAYRKFLQQTAHSTRPRQHRHTLFLRWTCTAAAIVLLAVGFSVVRHYLTPVEESSAILTPGEQKGMLELTDGRRIGIEKKEMSLVEGDIAVNYKQGVLSYTPATTQPVTQTDEETESTEYNKFVIPRGGENTVILSDGTSVKLNADSRLTYPIRFKGNRRIVMLEGEAYFEVKKDAAHPFVVRTQYGDITVLGTSFNVNAYADNDACYTTLVEGKVRVSTPLDESRELLPGEQSIVRVDRIETRKVHVEDYVGWTKGIFSFHNAPLEEIMSTLERWYDTEIIFEEPSLKQLTYTGTVKRYENINTFLDAFEMTGDLRYRIHQRKVYLSPGEPEKE